MLSEPKIMIAYDLVGQTPLALLESFSDENAKIYAKLEQFNPGGSIKDRLGKYLIEKAIDGGRLREGDTVVEAIAGNTGVGLAIVSNRYKVKCVILAPEGFVEEKISIMKALGADVRRTSKAEGMIGAQQEALVYATRYEYLHMNQFETRDNPGAYTQTLAKQLTDELSHIDYFVADVRSGGTLTGAAQHLKTYDAENYIVEPKGSVSDGDVSCPHAIEGTGSEKWPSSLEKELVDGIFTVIDKDAFNNVKLVANEEGLLVGSSSGVALQGALESKKSTQNGVIVTIFPDGSDRYMPKQIFSYKESFNNE